LHSTVPNKQHHLSPQIIVNSDGQQFHQYQQINKQHHLSPQIIVNSDGQQFHQYQQINKQHHLSPQIIEHKKDHDTWRWKSSSWVGTGIAIWIG
jgi:uncharacterized protein YdbL (DUF1318 family)